MLGIFKKKKQVKTVSISNAKVTCPNCNVSYEASMLLSDTVKCQDCGCNYVQKTHSDRVIDWVREKILTVGAC